MMRIRPATSNDHAALMSLAKKTGPGLTTLPDDEAILAEKIEMSIASFNKDVSMPGLENYLFFLEDTKTDQVVGCCALAATVGLEDAFYTYHLGTVVHTSVEHKVHNIINTLYLGNDFTGTTEICTLFLDPTYRKNGNGQLLSRCRFLFIALFKQRFAAKVIAEMRGISDENGESPFWNALGNHFFTMPFTEADALSAEGHNQFIAELMPKYPIYLPFLPKEARDVIGIVHPDTRPAIRMLEKEGFEYRGYVDIFDAGPTIEVTTDKIRSIRKSFNYPVEIIADDDFEKQQSQQYMLATQKLEDFRAGYGNGVINNDKIAISCSIANNLQLKSGEVVRALATGR